MDLFLIVAYLVGLLIWFYILYAVVVRAVTESLDRHYRTVRWYEHTGEWPGKQPPRPFNAGPVNPKK
ncbi:hypothetical protein J7E25_09820 [Agromyces sp. ISL-38]|uniref:hypothetical protein n=1 Tax=Agromyces sp. ISL-38 TaxID=2819107 RepID=UPI001BE77CF5|nr:hypothetical protein [Agromyces sp. ISL-38]MBT2499397.1 hypothetical protein [Agromyces sp. ISL-38]